jgi:hypothetical protein
MLNTKPTKNKNNNLVGGTSDLNSNGSIKNVVFQSPKKQLENIVNESKVETQQFISDNSNKKHYSNNFDKNLNNTNNTNNTNNANNFKNKFSSINSHDKFENIKKDFANSNSYLEIEKNNNNNNNFYSDVEHNNNIPKFKHDNVVNEILFKNKYNTIEKEKNVLFNSDDNSYIIMNNGNIDCVITNNNIVDYIFNIDSSASLNIKKYIFIISKNEITNNYEFNFINTIFTNDLDIIIKLQNFIYEMYNNFPDDDSEKTEIILLFYYQLIIWLFKNYLQYEGKFDSQRISRFFSSLTYRFSLLVLKNIIKTKNNLSIHNNAINEINNLKNKLLDEVNNVNSNNSDTENSDTENSDTENSVNSSITENDSSGNESDDENSEHITSLELYDKMNIKKNGKKINRIDEIFSDINSKNDQTTINDTIDVDKKFTSSNSNSNLIDDMTKNSDIKNKKNNITYNKNNLSSDLSANKYSFNSRSAEKNSKIYKIEI